MSDALLPDALQRLADRGLHVRPVLSMPNRYRIMRSYTVADDNPHFIKPEEMSQLYLDDSQWVFTNWQSVPGPGMNDFQCEFDTLEQSAEVAEQYYFGQPLIIDGWVVPLHRHPELNPLVAETAIANVSEMAGEAFMVLKKQMFESIWGFPPGSLRYEKVLQSTFLSIRHATDDSVTLCLRRDGAEAYIIPAGFYPHNSS
jgi:hypothetical protein